METQFLRGDSIGRGSFGSVNLAVLTKFQGHSKHRAAVKSCPLPSSSSLLHEKNILTLLGDSPNIIRYLGDSLSHENGVSLYNVFLEYAPGGSLADRVRSLGSGLPEQEVRKHARSILKALSHMHRKGLVHCDVKLQNVLLCRSGAGTDDVAKVCDFGLSKFSGERVEGFHIRGTPMMMSPESVNSGEFEPPADVWSLGCTVSEMFTGESAWQCSPDDDLASLLFRIGSGDESPRIPGAFSEDGKDFLRRCFTRDPRERWTAEMLLNHEFVSVMDVQESNAVFGQEMHYSVSPRRIFDFPTRFSPCDHDPESLPESDWNSGPSAEDRMRQLWSGEGPDWTSKSWVNVRL